MIMVIDFSLALAATVVEIYEFDGSNWSQWAARHLVREIGPLPEDFHVSWVHMDRNAFGRLDDGRLFTHYKANVVAIENGDSMELSVLDGSDLLVTNSGSNIDSDDRDVEPGTFFFTIAPVHSAFNVSTVVLKNYGYMEFLMSKKRILEHRRFAIRQDAPAAKAVAIDVHGSSGPLQGILGQSRRPRSEKHTENASGKGRPIHVCIWGSSKLDGQKSIWINQVQHMNEQTFDGVRYTFTWILTSNTTGPGTPEVLSDLPTPPQILSSPFENLGIDIDDLNQDPGTLDDP